MTPWGVPPPAAPDKHDEGIMRKFRVERLTPSSRGINHDACPYFVLDMNHDAHARAAALAYAQSCESEYPNLARDLRAMAMRPVKSVPMAATPSDQGPSQKKEGPHA